MKARGIFLALLCSCFCFSGCATMFTEKTQEISFKTKPAKAEVALGTNTCITPCTMKVDKGKWQLQAIVTKDGYAPQTLFLVPKLEPWFWGNTFTMGIGFVIDWVQGTAVKYEPEYYIPLSKQGFGGYREAEPVASIVEREPARPAKVEPAPTNTKAAPLAAAEERATSAKSRTVALSKAKLRAAPKKNGYVVKTLKKGEQVKIIQNREGWWLVELDGGEVGWCHESVLKN